MGSSSLVFNNEATPQLWRGPWQAGGTYSQRSPVKWIVQSVCSLIRRVGAAHLKVQESVDLALQDGHSFQQLLYRHGPHRPFSPAMEETAQSVSLSFRVRQTYTYTPPATAQSKCLYLQRCVLSTLPLLSSASQRHFYLLLVSCL